VTTATVPERGRMAELALYFLRLGFLGFGGPVALVGQMERELVNDKKWLSKEEMRESIAICQSLPGPLAIQVGIYVAWLRCSFWGAWLGGWCFILPNFVIVAALDTKRDDDFLRNRIKNGKSGAMPAFASMFSDAQIDQIIKYIRELKPHEG